MTAYGALIEFGQLRKKEFVIVTAASSSAGLAAIQTVKAEGAIAIATTRTHAKRAELIALGADHVIVTDEENLVDRVRKITNGAGARIIFDPIGGPIVNQLAEAAAPGATIFQYGLLSENPTPFPLVLALQKGLNIRGYWLPEIVLYPDRMARARSYVFDKLKSGQFKPKIAKTFPLEKVADAYRYLESNQQIGKVVVTVGSNN